MAVATLDQPETSPRLNPHLLALLKWCASLVWEAAADLLRRILELPPLVTLPPLPDGATVSGGSGAPHISHTAASHCRVLRSPPTAAVDVIFVHGLYGSLANTWKQGQWRKKKTELNKIQLRRHSYSDLKLSTQDKYHRSFSDPFSCVGTDGQNGDESMRCFCNITKEELKFKSKTNEARIFETKTKDGDEVIATNDERGQSNETIGNMAQDFKDVGNVSYNNGDCNNYDYDDVEIEYFIDDKDKFEAYDDDKYAAEENLNNDRVCANAKTECECEKFYKQDNYTIPNEINKIVNNTDETEIAKNCPEKSISSSEKVANKSKRCEIGCGCLCPKCYSDCWPRDWLGVDFPDARVISIDYTSDPHLWRPIWIKEHKRLRLQERARQMIEQLAALGVGERPIVWVGHSKGGLFVKQIYVEGYKQHCAGGSPAAALWRRSVGFMFYSVPHRGSPLADLRLPPLLARSVELLEMGRDCADVLALQSRWLRALPPLPPAVRSLVETRRTLMAVLWLTIVSYDSADAGIGALWGVSVDHREICKPSSRRCPLYRELLTLIDDAMKRNSSR